MTSIKGAGFFDNEENFNLYRNRRHDPHSPNETLEKPVILELIGTVDGLSVLDLGCGDAAFGEALLEAGCQYYLGVESSANMARLGAANLDGLNGEVINETIEGWAYPSGAFDLAVSRLALHYVEDFGRICRLVFRTLRPGGRFVFSCVHPVITSSDDSGGGRRKAWTVDRYFETGPRSVQFMGGRVEQFHRTVEDFFSALQRAGFTVDQLRESHPRREHFEDEQLYRRRMRIPLFIFFAARKAQA